MSALEKIEENNSEIISTDDQIMSVVMKMASNPDFDVEKMERLIAMQERATANRAKQAYFAAMVTAQNDMKPIAQDAENKHTHSKYATLEAINKAIQPVIAANGFSISFGEDATEKVDHYRVVATIRHVDGHAEREYMDVPSDGKGAQGKSNKNATQAFGSSVTYARRYLTMAIFNLSITGEDDDANSASENPPRFERLTPHRARQLIDFQAILKEIDEGQDTKLKNLEEELKGRLSFLPELWVTQFMERIALRHDELQKLAEEIEAQERGHGAPVL